MYLYSFSLTYFLSLILRHLSSLIPMVHKVAVILLSLCPLGSLGIFTRLSLIFFLHTVPSCYIKSQIPGICCWLRMDMEWTTDLILQRSGPWFIVCETSLCSPISHEPPMDFHVFHESLCGSWGGGGSHGPDMLPLQCNASKLQRHLKFWAHFWAHTGVGMDHKLVYKMEKSMEVHGLGSVKTHEPKFSQTSIFLVHAHPYHW